MEPVQTMGLFPQLRSNAGSAQKPAPARRQEKAVASVTGEKPKAVAAAAGLAAPLVQLVQEPAPASLSKADRVVRWVVIGGIFCLVVWLGWRFIIKPLWESEKDPESYAGVYAAPETDPSASTGDNYWDRVLQRGKYAWRNP